MEISVCPTVASVDCPNPLKISAMPHTPKLMIKTPITTAIMVLPSQFDEAFRIPRSIRSNLFCRREPGRAQANSEIRIPQRGITGLKKHHKVAASSSQPWRGDLKRLAFSLADALELATAL